MTAIVTLRTERMWIKGNKRIQELCHISKNLYNQATYISRQEFFSGGKRVSYQTLNRLLKSSENYQALPAQTAQQVLQIVSRNWTAYRQAVKAWKKDPSKFLGRPGLPGYKEKDGAFLLPFTNQQAKIRDGMLRLPSKILKMRTRCESVFQARIIPRGVGYIVEIVRQVTLKNVVKRSRRILGIDLGIRNIATIANNIGVKPIVIKGGVVKSINQYFNKRKAELQSVYDLQKVTDGKRLRSLCDKRERKMTDALHKISSFIVQWCVKHKIDTIVLGYNEHWKERITLGRVTNQNFASIPHYRLSNMLKYKAEDQGLRFIEQEESYTSKCSFFDNESIEHHDSYAGRRLSRGVFRTATRHYVNADVNAACNIIRKAIPNAFNYRHADGIEGVGLHPERCANIF